MEMISLQTVRLSKMPAVIALYEQGAAMLLKHRPGATTQALTREDAQLAFFEGILARCGPGNVPAKFGQKDANMVRPDRERDRRPRRLAAPLCLSVSRQTRG